DRITVAVLRQGEDWLSCLHHLTGLETARGNHARGAGAELGVAERIVRRAQLSLRGLKGAFGAAQRFLRLIEGHLGGETVDEQGLLPIKVRLCYAQLGLRRSFRGGRGINIGLLLGRIEPRQDVASIDVGADIDKAREDAATYAKREIGAKTRLNFAGKSHRS